MLNFITVKNYALIESSELEFAPGFNVFTGESGAGKSILLGAMTILLSDFSFPSVAIPQFPLGTLFSHSPFEDHHFQAPLFKLLL